MIGFGAEYSLADGFSIGGEFGLRLLSNSSLTTDEFIREDDTSIFYKWEGKLEVKSLLSGTFTTLSLNFHF